MVVNLGSLIPEWASRIPGLPENVCKIVHAFSGECRIASNKCSKKSVNQKTAALFAHHLNKEDASYYFFILYFIF